MNDNNLNKRPSIRDLHIDRPNPASQKERRMPEETPVRRRRRRGKLFWWILATVLLIGAIVVSLPIIFSETTIKITPKVTKAVFDNAVFNAIKVGTENTDSAGLLTYRITHWEERESTSLEPTGREQVSQKASGVITVFNNYTSKKQRLIKNTRFETQDGRVYRVRNSIMVPGKTSAGPGKLDVTVYADEAGDKYNLDSADFTLPGLKSLPDMYSEIYAKTKTAITGGFVGERAVVSDEARKTAVDSLKKKIESKVYQDVTNRVTKDSIFFKDGVDIKYSDPSEDEVDGKLKISLNADVNVITFDKKDFAKAISQGVAGNPTSGYPVIKDISKLKVHFDKSDDEMLKIVITGPVDFIWMFDVNKLKQDLAGKDKDSLKTIMTGYPMAEKANAYIRPFWRSTFPSNSEKINVEILPVE